MPQLWHRDLGLPHLWRCLSWCRQKGVDTALLTDLLSLAWQGAYDVAILVTSDADFIPAVEHVQAKGLKVVNAGWPNIGYELKAACWANFDISRVSGSLCRPTT